MKIAMADPLVAGLLDADGNTNNRLFGTRSRPSLMHNRQPSMIDQEDALEDDAFLDTGASTLPLAKPQSRRRWCRILLLLIVIIVILLAIAIPVIWYVILPRYVASKMADARVQINSMQMRQTAPDGFHTAMNLSMTNLPSDFDTRLKGMTVHVTYNGTHVGSVEMPEISFAKGTHAIDLQVESKFTIANHDHWVACMRDIINRDNFEWVLKSDASVVVAGTPVGEINFDQIEFSKPVVNKGMNMLRDVKVLEMRLPGNLNWNPDWASNPQKDGRNPDFQGLKLAVKVQIENPSDMAMELGDVTFSLHYKAPLDGAPEVPVGLLSAADLKMAPGSNVLQMEGAFINPDTMPVDLRGSFAPEVIREWLSDLINRCIRAETIYLKSRGWKLDYLFNREFQLPPPNRPSWLAEGIRGIDMMISHREDPEVVGRTHLVDLSIDKLNFKIRSGYNKECKPVVSGSVQALLYVPYPFDMQVRRAAQNIEVYRCLGDAQSKVPCAEQVLLGYLNSQYDEAVTRPDDGSPLTSLQSNNALNQMVLDRGEGRRFHLSVALNNGTRGRTSDTFLRTTPETELYYKQFVRDLLLMDAVPVRFLGRAHADVELGLGLPFFIRDLEFDKQMLLPGLKDMVSGGPKALKVVKNLDVVNTERGNVLRFEMPGTYFRRVNRVIGLELAAQVEFGLYYRPEVDPTTISTGDGKGPGSSIGRERKVGVITLPSMNLGDTATCNSTIYEPLSQTYWHAPDGADYCPVAPLGVFQSAQDDRDEEICEDRNDCVGRSFLSSYISNTALLKKNLKLTLKAERVPADLDLARKFLQMPDIELPGYTEATNHSRAPFSLVKRIIVKPTGNLFRGQLSAWLELYNPLRVNVRYYYIHVQTYVGNLHIGTLHINLTRYDPFERKTGYVFQGYPPRKSVDPKKDPYGPHASDWCVKQGDCQLAPVDVKAEGFGGPACTDGYGLNTTWTRRLDVAFKINGPSAVQFWRSIWSKHGAKQNVTIRGQVLIGMNTNLYTGPPRNDTSEPSDDQRRRSRDPRTPRSQIDPYWFSEDIPHSEALVTWIDFGQVDTEMNLLRFWTGDTPVSDVPGFPDECVNEGV